MQGRNRLQEKGEGEGEGEGERSQLTKHLADSRNLCDVLNVNCKECQGIRTLCPHRSACSGSLTFQPWNFCFANLISAGCICQQERVGTH